MKGGNVVLKKKDKHKCYPHSKNTLYGVIVEIPKTDVITPKHIIKSLNSKNEHEITISL